MTQGAWWRSVAAMTVVVGALLLARLWPDEPAGAPTPTTVPGGNGVAALPPARILEAARTELLAAGSVRLRGDFDDAGTPLRLDVRLLAEGDVSGWVSSDGRRLRVISTDGRTYLRGRQALAQWGSPAVAERVGDRWVVLPGRGEGLPGTLDLVRFADQTLGPAAAAGMVAGPTGSVGGRPALRLDGAQGSWWIALTGPPYPLRLESRVALGGPVQRLDLSEFDSHVVIGPPADPVDLGETGDDTGDAAAG